MYDLLLTDIVRYCHLLGVAVGLGGSVLADVTALDGLRSRVSRSLADRLHLLHLIVWGALGVMWVSGLALVFIRTGFVLENFSPKLISKLGVVALLTANAILIGRVAMPTLRASQDRLLTDMPLSALVPLALISGVSSASWLLALAMGSSKVLAQSGWLVFIAMLPAAYIVAVIAALFVLLIAVAMQRQPVGRQLNVAAE